MVNPLKTRLLPVVPAIRLLLLSAVDIARARHTILLLTPTTAAVQVSIQNQISSFKEITSSSLAARDVGAVKNRNGNVSLKKEMRSVSHAMWQRETVSSLDILKLLLQNPACHGNCYCRDLQRGS